MSTLNKSDILLKIKQLQPIYIEDGFIIEGIFGSYARDEAKVI